MEESNKFNKVNLQINIRKDLVDRLGDSVDSLVETLLEEHLDSKVKPNRFEYLVNYAAPNQIGRIQILRQKVLDSYDELEELDEYIRTLKGENKFSGLFVTDFKLLRSYYDDEQFPEGVDSKKSEELDKNKESFQYLTYETLKSALGSSEDLKPYKSNLHCLIMSLKNIVNRASFKVNLNEIIITNKYSTIELIVAGPKDRPTYVIPDGLEYYTPGFDAIVDLRVNGITSTELQPSMLKNMAIVSNLDLRVSGLTKNK